MRKATLLLLCLYAYAATATDKTPNGKTITTEKGDVIVFSSTTTKEMHIANTNERKVVDYGTPQPVLLNGKEIYYVMDDKPDTVNNFRNSKMWIEDHIRIWQAFDKIIKIEKQKLPAGSYEMVFKDLIINEQGNVVYYTTNGIVRRKQQERLHVKTARLTIPSKLEETINTKLKDAMSQQQYTPLLIANKPVAYYNYHTYSFNIE
ncbi:hypothetical protein CAP35_06405 [Chitinophagaceae bacterium IBVUCB1]|nr:hypothetical protein CAP35_06405 [Chitinophagaceae bacterium IBVUCB1]